MSVEIWQYEGQKPVFEQKQNGQAYTAKHRLGRQKCRQKADFRCKIEKFNASKIKHFTVCDEQGENKKLWMNYIF